MADKKMEVVFEGPNALEDLCVLALNVLNGLIVTIESGHLDITREEVIEIKKLCEARHQLDQSRVEAVMIMEIFDGAMH